MNAAPLTDDLRSPRAAHHVGVGLAVSLALHGAVLATALFWRSGSDASPASGFIVEVAFLETPAAAPLESVAEVTPELAPASAPPPLETAVPAEAQEQEEAVAEPVPPAPVEVAAVEPEVVPPPEPEREVVLPLPRPPQARPQSPKRRTETARPAPEAAPPRAPRSPVTETQLASAGPAPRAESEPSSTPAPSAAAAPTAAPAGAAPAPDKAPMTVAAAGPGPLVVTNPRFRERPVPPSYPRRALDLGQEGEVIVRALVGPGGDSREVKLWRSSGVAALDEAALRAVRRWAFEAARIDGRPVEAWVEVPVRFQLRTVL